MDQPVLGAAERNIRAETIGEAENGILFPNALRYRMAVASAVKNGRHKGEVPMVREAADDEVRRMEGLLD